MKKLISLLMTIAVLLSVLQPAWAIEEAAEIDAVAASRNLIVVVPGIIGSELVDGNGAKVWVGVGGILGQIQCNEVGMHIIMIIMVRVTPIRHYMIA